MLTRLIALSAQLLLLADFGESTPACADSSATLSVPTVSLVNFGTLSVSLSVTPVSVASCRVRVDKWNGVSQISPVLQVMSGCDGFLIFQAANFGNLFSAGGLFEFVLQGLDSLGDVVCASATEQYTLPQETCSASMVISRPDSVSLSLALPYSADRVGLCRFTLERYKDEVFSPVLVAESGPCSSAVRFQSDRKSVSMLTADRIDFRWSYLFDSQMVLCTSTVLFTSIGAPTCTQPLEMVRQSAASIFVGIAEPKPLEGTCKLVLRSCTLAAAFTPIVIALPSCQRPFELSFSMLAGLGVTDAVPGQSCTLSWTYTYGSESCASVNTFTTPSLKESCSLSVASRATGSLSFSPSVTTHLAGGACEVAFLGCGSTILSSPLVKRFASCAGTSTLTFDHTDSAAITANSACTFQLKQIAAGETFSASTKYACDSGLVTFVTAADPSWARSGNRVHVVMRGEDCVEVTWDAVDSTGGSPVLCYRVSRQDGSSWRVIQDCGQSPVWFRRVESCGLDAGVTFAFRVSAVNRVGESAVVESTPVKPEYLKRIPESDLVVPLTDWQWISGAAPLIHVQARISSGVVDPVVNQRVFAVQVVAPCSLDSATSTFLVPVNGPAVSLLPAFSGVLEPLSGAPAEYGIVPDFVPVGEYSVVTYSVEEGGLQAQYWANAFFHSSPVLERKDRNIDFDWDHKPVINVTGSALAFDLAAVRWTGFVKPRFSELYTFTVTTTHYLQVFVDHVVVMDKWATACTAACSFSVQLNSTQLHSIRIDYRVSKGFAQTAAASIALSWRSYSQAQETVPSERLSIADILLPMKAIVVEPDVYSFSDSGVSVLDAQVTAGENAIVSVRAKDRFGQQLTSNNDVFTCTISNGFTTLSQSSVPVSGGVYEVTFTPTDAGLYTITVLDTDGNALTTSGLSITVIAAAPFDVYDVSVAADIVAGSPAVTKFQLRDVYGNTVNGSLLSTSPAVSLSVEWQYDASAVARLGLNGTDIFNRTGSFGTVFSVATANWLTDRFSAAVTLPLAGVYAVKLAVGTAHVQSVPDWTVVASPAVSGNNSVIVSQIPAYIRAGVAETLTVQLRDVFKNCITSTPTGLAEVDPVVLSLVHDDGDVVELTECTAATGVLGQFTCTVTAERAGAAQLSLLVNGEESVVIPSQALGYVSPVKGPFAVTVIPGVVDMSLSVVEGLQPVYRVSAVAESSATLRLRDAYGNAIAPLGGVPSITAAFRRADTSIAATLDTSSFSVTPDAGVSMPIRSSLATPTSGTDADAAGWTFVVTIDGQDLVISQPKVRFLAGAVSARGSACTLGATQTAGTPFSVTCNIADVFGNVMDKMSVYVNAVFSLPPTTTDFRAAHQAGGAYSATAMLFDAGEHDASVIIGQPGGLFAEYFADSSFNNLLADPASRLIEGPKVYSTIERSLNIDGTIFISGLGVASAIWSGMIAPPGAQTVRFLYTAYGAIRIVIGTTSVVNVALSTGQQTSFDFTFADTTPLPIHIEYVPASLTLLQLVWQYPTLAGSGFPIPPSALLAPRTAGISNAQIQVSPSVISGRSLATAPASFLMGIADSIMITAKDPYGNLIADQASCRTTSGTSPACLFHIELDQDDGTVIPAVTFLSSGLYRADTAFATAGVKLLHVNVVTGDTTRDPVAGSPLSILVT